MKTGSELLGKGLEHVRNGGKLLETRYLDATDILRYTDAKIR